jgi:hypothetical protein
MDQVLCGDLNGSLHRRKYKHDPILQSYVDKEGWSLAIDCYPTESTFISSKEGSESIIDYVLVKQNVCDCDSVKVLHHPLNTSDHRPVQAVFDTYIIPKPMAQAILRPAGRPRWHKADINQYARNIDTLLAGWEISTPGSPYSIELATMDLINTLRKAEEGSVPRPSCVILPRKPKPIEWVEIHKKVKEAHGEWCVQGKARGDIFEKLKDLKRQLRQTERQQAAKRRDDLYRDIESAATMDSKIFFRLVNKQRSNQTGPSTTELVYKGCTYREDNILEGWASYFSDLSTPNTSSNPEFDQEFSEMVNRDIEIYTEMSKMSLHGVEPFTAEEVAVCIRRLHANKAADKFGLTAEHLRHAGSGMAPVLAHLFNNIATSGAIPTAFKEGILSPLLKKPKLPRRIPSNYRGITIICVIGKVLELLLILRCGHLFRSRQNPLQRGFTQQISPIYAALIVMEIINEFKDNNSDLTVIFLDAEKAFDKVWHSGLFRRLILLGMPNEYVGLLQDW